jgi:ribose transport system ATP-binding protein
MSRLMRKPRKELRVFKQIAADLQLRPSSPTTAGSAFSGGNAQKLILGRWLCNLRDIALLLLDEPTQGVDVGSRAQIYQLLRRFAKEATGRAAIFATSDPEEAIALADRIVVLVNGQVAHVVDRSIGEAELLSLAQIAEIANGTTLQLGSKEDIAP